MTRNSLRANIWDDIFDKNLPGCSSGNSSIGKESTCNAEDPSSISGLGNSAGEGIGYPLQYSGLENSMDCINHGVAKSWIQLSNFHFHFSGKKSPCQCRRHKRFGGSNLWTGKIPWRRALLCSCLENPMDRGAWQATVHRVAKSWTQLKWISSHAYAHCNTSAS